MSNDLSVPASLISERMGLYFQEDRWPELGRGLEKAAASLGFDNVHAFIARLVADNFGQREVQALATHLTIGETHFFRSPETFTMLQSSLLPELIAAHQNTDRRLRIWSAGCATGQEPFSLAILASRLIPDLDTWDLTILATDINPDAFEAAKTAEYTQWSFRGTPQWVINGYFTHTAGGRYRLDSVIRNMVTFRYLNLAEDVYPSVATGVYDFDLILCRNVIMYFARDMAIRVAERLRRSLAEGGYLLVTASEASREIQSDLTQTIRGGEIVYKKIGHVPDETRAVRRGHPSARAAQQRRRADPPDEVIATRSSRVARKEPVEMPAPSKQAGVERRGKNRPFAAYAEQLARQAARPAALAAPQDAAREARLLADKGDLKQALARCEAALEADKLNPSLYYLKASILQELGQPGEAERALQSTLFLDDSFALARVMLGAIARGQSRSSEAAKHFRAALSLLEQMPSNSVLPETDGLTAGEMAETVASLMRSECVS